jgi:hypothetical protein
VKIRKPSDFIKKFSASLAYGLLWVLLVRVSTAQQGKKRNSRNQELEMRRAVEEAGGTVLEECVFREEQKGNGPEWEQLCHDVAEACRENNAALLIADPSRLLRHPQFLSTDSVRCRLQPIPEEWNNMAHIFYGVEVYSLNDPDATPEQTRSYLTKLGQSAKGKKGGGDHKQGARKRFKKKWFPYVIHYYTIPGWKKKARRITRKVCKESGRRVTERTIRNWIKEYETGGAV